MTDDILGRHLHYVNDAEMNVANFGAIVVYQSDSGFVRGVNVHFFLQFATPTVVRTAMRGEQVIVLISNVAANANRKEAVQPCFLSAFAAAIAKDAIVAENEHVRDKLLVPFVLLGFAAIEVSDLRGCSDDRQILFDVQAQSLKNAAFLQELALETKDFFFFWHRLYDVCITFEVEDSGRATTRKGCWRLSTDYSQRRFLHGCQHKEVKTEIVKTTHLS